ncbi:hypothetical protein [Cupriavidus pauculus]|uniref:Uncharacterized protein n=1 Tax=Cupriavidus pauculus TaxID=82633 RepID=A0A2N5CG47_9BURK|nr:hypothetical protein [Cupriavidus pauculus]PLQ01174.1 hypothetical protein CYJ10_05625 [Cupriavidus pauculus]
MAMQRPGGTRPTTPRTGKPHTSTPRDSAQWHDLGADTAIWHTRGLQANTRMRAPVAQRTPSRQLPPSPVPKLILWAVLIGIALVCFNAVKHML